LEKIAEPLDARTGKNREQASERIPATLASKQPPKQFTLEPEQFARHNFEIEIAWPASEICDEVPFKVPTPISSAAAQVSIVAPSSHRSSACRNRMARKNSLGAGSGMAESLAKRFQSLFIQRAVFGNDLTHR
jgi:hypothetical protein